MLISTTTTKSQNVAPNGTDVTVKYLSFCQDSRTPNRFLAAIWGIQRRAGKKIWGRYGGIQECSICNGFWRIFEGQQAFLRAKIEPHYW